MRVTGQIIQSGYALIRKPDGSFETSNKLHFTLLSHDKDMEPVLIKCVKDPGTYDERHVGTKVIVDGEMKGDVLLVESVSVEPARFLNSEATS